MPEGPSGLTVFIESIARAQLTTVMVVMVVATLVRAGAILGRERTYGLNAKVLHILADLADAVIYAGILVFMVIRPFVLQTFWIPSESMEQTLLKGDYLVVNKAVYRTRDPKAGEIVVFRAPDEALMPGQPVGKTDFIKRCIGTPGMLVEIRKEEDGSYRLYRDGKPVDEKYLGSPIPAAFKLVKIDPAKLLPSERAWLREVWRKDLPDYVSLQRETQIDPFTQENVEVTSVLMHRLFGEGRELGDKLWALPAEPLPPDHYLMMGDNRSYSSDGRVWGIVQRWRIIGRADFVFLPLSRWQAVPNNPY